MPEIILDDKGFPVFRADVPNAGVARVDPNAKSGNDAHDARSGKFASKSGGDKRKNTPPPNVSPADYNRMLDAVREAARQFPGNLSEETLSAFIQKRAQDPSAVNIQQFLAMAQQQQMADLVDLIDSTTKKSGIKMSAPRGYVKKVLAGLSDDNVSEIAERLRARGNDPLIINKFIVGERKIKKPEDVAAAQWTGHGVEVVEFQEPEGFSLEDFGTPPDPVQLAEQIVSNMPAPIINVTVEPPKPTRKEIRRDPKTGLVAEVIEISDE